MTRPLEEEEEMMTLASELLGKWSNLKEVFRIPKKAPQPMVDHAPSPPSHYTLCSTIHRHRNRHPLWLMYRAFKLRVRVGVSWRETFRLGRRQRGRPNERADGIRKRRKRELRSSPRCYSTEMSRDLPQAILIPQLGGENASHCWGLVQPCLPYKTQS